MPSTNVSGNNPFRVSQSCSTSLYEIPKVKEDVKFWYAVCQFLTRTIFRPSFAASFGIPCLAGYRRCVGVVIKAADMQLLTLSLSLCGWEDESRLCLPSTISSDCHVSGN
jgi:hypothetical protein